MNTDEHGYPDSLTGRILGAEFEVSNSLVAVSWRRYMSVPCCWNSGCAHRNARFGSRRPLTLSYAALSHLTTETLTR
jgi:hypothetical protein